MTEKQDLQKHQLSLGVVLKRALKLRCPLCGEGKLFEGYFRMPERCKGCNLKYEEAPGYFLGSTYINYGLTITLTTVSYIWLHFIVGIKRDTLIPFYVIFIILFALFFFRYARSFWLAIDKWLSSLGPQNIPGDDIED